MTAGLDWLDAFPLGQASKAVQAIQLSWEHWASRPREHFHHGVREPDMTKVVRQYADRFVSRDLGLIGYWGAEPTENEVDPETGEILEEIRSDIVFAWNNDEQAIRLVFEFKKLNHRDSSREYYLGKNGLLRFVTGAHSQQQAIAVMVGILLSEEPRVVPALRRSLQVPAQAGALKMLKQHNGRWLSKPSVLFPNFADFDTEHERVPALAPTHGTIRVAHAFVGFGYSQPAKKKTGSRKRTLDALET